MDSMVEREEGLARPSDPALVSDQAASRLAPSGFDPSRVGFTGTQHGVTAAQRYSLLFVLAKARVRGAKWMDNGDCIGADNTAGNIWRCLEGLLWLHPPTNASKRANMACDFASEPLPYLDRNRAIVDKCDWLICTPAEMFEQQRSGTWATIRYARKVGRNHAIVWPNGRVDWHRDSDTHRDGGDALAAPFMGSAGREASPVSSRLSDTEGR